MEKNRNELLNLLDRLGRTYPEWRLGQLIMNLANFSNAEPWDVEDDQLIRAAREHLENTVPQFDDDEFETRRRCNHPGYTIEEVGEHLHSLKRTEGGPTCQ